MRGLHVGVIVFSFLAALLLAPAAHATLSIPVSGNWVVTEVTIRSVQLVDGKMIIRQTTTFDFTGTFSGTMVADQMMMIELDTGKFEGMEAGWLTGSVAGESGFIVTFDEFEGVGSSVEGKFEIEIGISSLGSFEGEGTFEGEGGAGTYSGQIKFDG